MSASAFLTGLYPPGTGPSRADGDAATKGSRLFASLYIDLPVEHCDLSTFSEGKLKISSSNFLLLFR